MLVADLAIYIGLTAVVLSLYLWWKARLEAHSIAVKTEALEAGLIEPASLHPIIDATQCIGCAACVRACPENSHHVIGIIHGKAELINPTYCIGHGACKTSCPVDAITLVFGTATRGMDIPTVQPNFETNVPGLFIAGELGGMGLIRNAIEQGKQALEGIRKLDGMGKPDQLDVLIIGAGPSGIAATLGAKAAKMKVETIEQDSLGGTVYQFPRGKIVMTAPVMLPVVGKMHFRETTKEKLLEFWQEVEQKAGLDIHYHERVEGVTRTETGFLVKTSRDEYRTRSVLLAIGRRGTPRKLGVPGEDQPKVVYRLIDPAQYVGQHVLVVGGGDSALEAAVVISEEEGTTVTISYRSESFSRAKEKNRQKVQAASDAGRLRVMMSSNVKEIMPDSVRMTMGGEEEEFPNDVVIICAGGILPTPFLKEIGIEVETKYGTT